MFKVFMVFSFWKTIATKIKKFNLNFIKTFNKLINY